MAFNNVTRERGYVEYNTTFIGTAVCVVIIVVLFSFFFNMKFLSQISGPVEHSPVTEIIMNFPEESLLLVPFAIVAVIVLWLYSRRNRSALETV